VTSKGIAAVLGVTLIVSGLVLISWYYHPLMALGVFLVVWGRSVGSHDG